MYLGMRTHGLAPIEMRHVGKRCFPHIDDAEKSLQASGRRAWSMPFHAAGIGLPTKCTGRRRDLTTRSAGPN